MNSPIIERLLEIEKKIKSACLKSRRNQSEIELLAVSKLESVEAIEAASQLGIRNFGENYVRELDAKRKKLAHLKDVVWHLIGHLQTNKVKAAVEIADVFHALDSGHLADELSKRIMSSSHPQRKLPLYIEVNIDEEKNKRGVHPDELQPLISRVERLAGLQLIGLMCIPEHKENPEDTRVAFKKMKRLCNSVISMNTLRLSMGMSNDFEIAIEEGSNCIRIGTGLFGKRDRKSNHGHI